jgi:hypothetical protein
MIVARVAASLGVFVCVGCGKSAIVGVIDLPPSLQRGHAGAAYCEACARGLIEVARLSAAVLPDGPMARDAMALARRLQDALEEG